MKKRAIKVLSAISTVFIGIFMVGFGFTTEFGHPVSTICFLLGLGLVFIGFIYFVKIAQSND
ncbi:MAG TPA: hypothetical protein PLP39_08050 [Flavobacterium lutivivi]|nr:hypothetical protein [Flavobacterium lutivivi]